ncbi:MAG TPA: pyridoxal phosphate-dependent aminotransferase [Terriglobales bacterium]|nr:pyridoxal phosphate-dependent aminotransferase [Terriglobales bacterium]
MANGSEKGRTQLRRPLFSQRTSWTTQPNPLSQAVAAARSSGVELLDLSESNPTRCGLQYTAAAILHAFQHQDLLHYAPDPHGLHSARAAVAAYYAELAIVADPGYIILTTGTSEAYSFLFRLLCNPGDEVLVPEPSYPLFEFLATLDDVTLRPYELVYHDGWQIDFASLTSILTERTRAVMLVNPNNPTGSYVKPRELNQLNALCAEHGLALIADEVFFDYALAVAGDHRRSFAQNHAALTFTLSGLSKIAALPQMKTAWIVVSGPGDQTHAALERLEVIADTFLSVSTPVQLALPQLLDQRRTVVPQLLQRIVKNLAELDRQLGLHRVVERLHIEGGWYVTLRVPATRSDEDLAVALVEQERVLVHPGHFYDFHRDGHLVLSLIMPERAFQEGLMRLLRFISDNSA